MKQLSIIIPTYNMEALLPACLTSLLVKRNSALLEVIVVNDGSTDGSSAIAHEFATKHPDTFRVIDKQNGHYGSCVNSGLKIATGRYVKILDADDMFDTANLDDYLDALQQTDADLVVTDYTKVTIKGKPYRPRRQRLEPNRLFPLDELCRRLAFPSVMMHAITYRTQLLRDIRYVQPEGILYTDDVWRFTPLAAVKTVVRIPLIIYQYRTGRDNQSMDVKVMRRNASHFLQIAHFKLDRLKELKATTNKDVYAMMERHIIINEGNTLKYGVMYGGLPNDDMLALDERVRTECPTIYDRVAQHKKFQFSRYNYVEHWRADREHYRFPRLLRAVVYVNDAVKNLVQQYKYLFH